MYKKALFSLSCHSQERVTKVSGNKSLDCPTASTSGGPTPLRGGGGKMVGD